ncbi:MAG: M20/M25/M40 family metallo-hydrolase [Chloroflexota bacterium]
MYKVILFLTISAASLLPVFAQKANTPAETRMLETVKYLASDELEGRYPGTEGDRKAAEYIKNYFQSLNLRPFDGGYLLPFKVRTGYLPSADSRVTFDVRVKKPGVPEDMIKPVVREWQINKDWAPLNFSENGSVSGALVFVGYGVTSETLAYDDYAGFDVMNKIVVVLTDTPDGAKKDGPFAGYATNRYKAKNARDHGAKAIIFVKAPGDSANVFEPLTVEGAGGGRGGIIAIQANRDMIAKLFPPGSQLLAAESQINKTRKPKSFIIDGVTANVKVGLTDQMTETFNVTGLLKGTDPALADEYVVIGGHYDHLGWGASSSLYRGPGKKIHNGADDNASGVAVVLELAKRLSANPPRRSVVFVAFSGEEMGVLGSHYFANNSPMPIEKTIAMINLDMVGRMKENKLNVFGSGSSPEFPALIDSLAALDSMAVTKAADAYGPSDHASFYSKNVPVLFLFTGVHGDYHTPNDDWDKINYVGMGHVADYAELFARHLANATEKPAFTEVKQNQTEMRPSMGSSNVWFGIVPNFEQTDLGCKISGASAGSPAQKAGFQADDIITSINGKQIKNLHDFMFTIREYKAGDKLNVEFLRNGKKETTEVVLVNKK